MSAVTLISVIIACSALAIATAILLWSFSTQGSAPWSKRHGHEDQDDKRNDHEHRHGEDKHGHRGEDKKEAGGPRGAPINQRTRGNPTAYVLIGTLYRTDENSKDSNQVLPLYGRQTYARGYRYNYYTVLESGVRVALVISGKNCSEELGCEEIYEDDTVNMAELKAAFKVRMYKENPYTYIPY